MWSVKTLKFKVVSSHAVGCRVDYRLKLLRFTLRINKFYFADDTGEGGWFVFFRLLKFILFVVDWISLNFFQFLIKYYPIMFIIIVFWLGYDRPSGLLFFVPALLISIFKPLFYLLRLFILFHSCCSHARLFGKTLVHEFLISYSHTEWCLLFSRFEILLSLAEASPIETWSYYKTLRQGHELHEALMGYCPWGWGVRPVDWIYGLWRHIP